MWIKSWNCDWLWNLKSDWISGLGLNLLEYYLIIGSIVL